MGDEDDRVFTDNREKVHDVLRKQGQDVVVYSLGFIGEVVAPLVGSDEAKTIAKLSHHLQPRKRKLGEAVQKHNIGAVSHASYVQLNITDIDSALFR